VNRCIHCDRCEIEQEFDAHSIVEDSQQEIAFPADIAMLQLWVANRRNPYGTTTSPGVS
jgi:hypothetical protein